MQPSISFSSSSVSLPARYRSNSLRPSVPDAMRLPRQLPASIGPPGTMIAGMSALAAPISCAGVVLSQPHSSTTPSSGLARIDSSTSIAIRLRNSMVVGRMNVSPSEIVGNSSGTPPAAQTPRFTASATSRKSDVAVVQFAPGVADADNRLALEDIGIQSLRADIRAPGEVVIVGSAEPRLAAE